MKMLLVVMPTIFSATCRKNHTAKWYYRKTVNREISDNQLAHIGTNGFTHYNFHVILLGEFQCSNWNQLSNTSWTGGTTRCTASSPASDGTPAEYIVYSCCLVFTVFDWFRNGHWAFYRSTDKSSISSNVCVQLDWTPM